MRLHNTCAREGCTKDARVRFCSDSCKTAFFNPLRDRTNHKTKDCAVCSKTFTDVPHRITCSDKCRQRLCQSRKIVKAAEANANY